jgi:hypothetical protein
MEGHVVLDMHAAQLMPGPSWHCGDCTLSQHLRSASMGVVSVLLGTYWVQHWNWKMHRQCSRQHVEVVCI